MIIHKPQQSVAAFLLRFAWRRPIMQIMELPVKEKVSLQEVVDIIVKGYGPIEKILLFGSHARGDADTYSDLDLIIIKKTEQKFVRRLLEVPLLPVGADVFVYTPEEFEQMKNDENPFIMSALASAKVIYEK